MYNNVILLLQMLKYLDKKGFFTEFLGISSMN